MIISGPQRPARTGRANAGYTYVYQGIVMRSCQRADDIHTGLPYPRTGGSLYAAQACRGQATG